MVKKIILSLCLVLLVSLGSVSFAKVPVSSELAESIKLYKAENYAECYVKLDTVIENDPANPLAYYYKAMTAAQLGKKAEAIDNYEKAITLAPSRSNIGVYAQKGKDCLVSPDTCNNPDLLDQKEKFIRGFDSSMFSQEAQSMHEKLKLEQMMRDINREEEINPQKFKEYRDFSAPNKKSEIPSNDEIVDAIKVLQNAGMLNFGMNNYSDLSILTGKEYPTSDLFGTSGIDSKLLQTMLTSGMSLGF